MVAYSFMVRFEPALQRGIKTQTVRPVGKRKHAQRGDLLQLYVAMRTKHCRLVRESYCRDNAPVSLRLAEGRPVVNNVLVLPPEEFARDDGFKDWRDLCQFWEQVHGITDVFDGRLIRWVNKT